MLCAEAYVYVLVRKKRYFLSQEKMSCNRLITKWFIIKISVPEKNAKGHMVHSPVYKFAHSKQKVQVNTF